MTPAHTQHERMELLEFFPAHEPREHDPHYALFEQARTRLKRAGKLVCWICGTTERVELHHARIEFALANGVDIAKFAAKCPELHVADEESFLRFVESEGNLLPLCVDHHRGAHGIHSMTYSPWVAQAYWKDDLPAPAVRQGGGDGKAQG